MNAQSAPTELMDGRVWEDFCESLKRAGQLVLANAPADAFDRAEGLRYAGRIASYALRNFIEESDPAAPQLAALPKLGGDNPDYLYSRAAISGEFEYRLRGTRGEASFLGFGSYHGDVGTEEGLRVSGYLAGAELETDGEGNFEIGISCREQPGNWLRLAPDTKQILLRQTFLHRAKEQPVEVDIECVGADVPPPAVDPARIGGQLAGAAMFAIGCAQWFADWVKAFEDKAPVNTFHLPTEENHRFVGGDPNIRIWLGTWRLGPDEALVIEMTPPDCHYWNFQLANVWAESLDYRFQRVHINNGAAEARPDGSVQLVVAHEDPGHPNFMTTTGHDHGTMCVRWVRADSHPEPHCRVVKLSELQGA